MPRTRKSGDGGLYFDNKRKLWIGVIDNGFTPEGKRRQARVTSKSQSIARQKLNKLKSEIDVYGSPLGNQTVAEWGAFWLEEVKRNKPGTYRSRKSILNVWVFPAIGRKNLKDVRPSDLRRIYDAIEKVNSTSTSLKAHTVMSAMFEAARLERLVPSNVTKDVRAPRAAKSVTSALLPSETLAALERATLVEDGTKWIISLYGGLRQGERLGATLDSYDRDRQRFRVKWNLVEGNYEHGCDGACGLKADGRPKAAGHCPQKSLVIPDVDDYRILKGRLMLVPPKSGEEREFPLPPQLAAVLDLHIASLTSRPNPYGLLWPAADGDPVDARDDQKQWKSLLAAAGIDRPDATTHWARHTAISDLTASGVPERVIGEIVGHKSTGVTGRYQHVASEDSAAAMARLGERRQLDK